MGKRAGTSRASGAKRTRASANDRRERFAEEYIVDLNVTQAAIRAGYSPKSAHVTGQRLLKHAKVIATIRQLKLKRSERLEISADRVIHELARIGFANMADYINVTADGDAFVDLSALDRDKAAAISEVTVEDFKDGRGEDARDVRRIKFKLADKRGALVDLGRHLGLFKDKVELTGKDDGPIQHQAVRPQLSREEWLKLHGGGAPA